MTARAKPVAALAVAAPTASVSSPDGAIQSDSIKGGVRDFDKDLLQNFTICAMPFETSRLTSITAGLLVGATGKALTNVVSVGIGDIAFLALYLCILHSRQRNALEIPVATSTTIGRCMQKG